jgi:hypothetical protein
LDIETQSITLKAGENSTENFYLVNNSSQNFYIDAVQAYDYDSGFESSAASLDDRADAFGGSADIQVKIHAFDSAQEKTGTAYLKVKGHFTDGKQCSYNDIGVASFNVSIKGKEVIKECSDFKLTVPAGYFVTGVQKNDGSTTTTVNATQWYTTYGVLYVCDDPAYTYTVNLTSTSGAGGLPTSLILIGAVAVVVVAGALVVLTRRKSSSKGVSIK